MNHAQMVKFIRSEGWKAFGLGRSWHKDPVKPLGHNTETAYRIAYKRKAQREARKLATMGFEYSLLSVGPYRWTKDYQNFYTKAQALAGMSAESV